MSWSADMKFGSKAITKAKTKTVWILFFYLMANPLVARAQDGDFYEMIHEALKRHAFQSQVDLNAADSRAFGFQVEKHGPNARVNIFDVTNPGELLTHSYGCQWSEVATCWKQNTSRPSQYSYGFSKYSAALQISSVGEVIETLKKEGVDAAKFSLLKLWQSSNLIHLRIGFEAGVVEINYDCDPTKQKMCRPAVAFPENEP
jgi:hypothetical protein